MRRLWAGLAAAAALTGSGATTGCDRCKERTENVEVFDSDPNRTLSLAALKRHRDNGWDCGKTEPIRNAFGGEIGTRCRCTICD